MAHVRGRRGFTIVETLVSVMVLAVGLLGLVSVAALATRMVSEGQRSTESAAIANERIEVLRAQGCPALVDGAESRGAHRVRWRVESQGAGRARRLTVLVTSPGPRGARTDTVTTVHVCS
jgi:Tfp pilus assembly protein PilV